MFPAGPAKKGIEGKAACFTFVLSQAALLRGHSNHELSLLISPSPALVVAAARFARVPDCTTFHCK